MTYQDNQSNEIFKRGSFDELFGALSNVLCHFKTKGFFDSVFDEIAIPQGISYPLIEKGVKLIISGACNSYFDFIIDLEFYKLITSNVDITENNLAEIILVKKTLFLLRRLDVNNFFELLNSVCSREASSNISNLLKANFKDKFDF